MIGAWKSKLALKLFLPYLGIVLFLFFFFYFYSEVALTGAVISGLILASALGLLSAYGFSRYLALRIRRMAEFSREVARGSFPREFLPRGEDELSLLEKSMNEMNRRIQEQIRGIAAEKEKVESILRCMSEGVVVVDTEGRILVLNENAKKMFNLDSARDLHGASLLAVSRHPEMKRLTEEVLSCDCSKECFSKEIVLDEGRCFRVNAASLTDSEGKTVGYIIVFHDITELKRLEAVRADFVANVSHELRTPLTAIHGYAETLLSSPPAEPGETEHFLGVIHRHSERLGRLIDDLLTLSDLESGKIRLSQERIAGGDLLGGVLEIFQDQARKKRIALSCAAGLHLPEIVGDRDRLQQLLINLIDNAIKYSPAGGRVSVTAQKVQRLGNSGRPMVEIAVSDTGCGIPENEIPRLTERFYRVDKTRSRELGGTGLGLAIVKHIVQAHGGLLKIKSQIQKGTTVRVFLPSFNPERSLQGVLFLCTANSCRSQMAEGFARVLAPGEIQIYSAGTDPKSLHPLAIRVMKEAGIDISTQRSKGLEAVPTEPVDLVVTICGEAAESCPAFPKKTERLHWPLPDPTRATGTEEEILKAFRDVRDDIRARVQEMFSSSGTSHR